MERLGRLDQGAEVSAHLVRFLEWSEAAVVERALSWPVVPERSQLCKGGRGAVVHASVDEEAVRCAHAREGDYRDWQTVDDWAASIGRELQQTRPVVKGRSDASSP